MHPPTSPLLSDKAQNNIESEEDDPETQEKIGLQEESSQMSPQEVVSQSTPDPGTLRQNLQSEELGWYQTMGECVPISSDVHQPNINNSLWTDSSNPGIIQCDLLLGRWTSQIDFENVFQACLALFKARKDLTTLDHILVNHPLPQDLNSTFAKEKTNPTMTQWVNSEESESQILH